MAALALSVTALPAGAFELMRTEGGIPLRWPNMPVRFAVGDARADTIGSHVLAVRKAFAAWEAPQWTALRTEFIGRRVTGLAGDEASEPGAVLVRWLDPWPDELGSSDLVVGITRVDYDAASGTILSARVAFNGARFRWATDGTAGRVDAMAAALHEGGHALGLDHSAVEDAVMFPRGTFTAGDRALHADDADGVSALYTASRPEPAPTTDGAWFLDCRRIAFEGPAPEAPRQVGIHAKDQSTEAIIASELVEAGGGWVAVFGEARWAPAGSFLEIEAENGKRALVEWERVERRAACPEEEDATVGSCPGCGAGPSSIGVLLVVAALGLGSARRRG